MIALIALIILIFVSVSIVAPIRAHMRPWYGSHAALRMLTVLSKAF